LLVGPCVLLLHKKASPVRSSRGVTRGWALVGGCRPTGQVTTECRADRSAVNRPEARQGGLPDTHREGLVASHPCKGRGQTSHVGLGVVPWACVMATCACNRYARAALPANWPEADPTRPEASLDRFERAQKPTFPSVRPSLDWGNWTNGFDPAK